MNDLIILQYGSFYVALGFIIILSTFAFYDPSVSAYKTGGYIASMSIALIIGFAIFVIYSTTGKMDYIKNGSIIIFIGLLTTMAVYLSMRKTITTPDTPNYWVYLENVILFFIIIIVLAIIFIVFSEYLQNLDGWLGIFVNLLFYIPCSFSDFIQFIFEQYKITPNMIFILFILELILILTYLYIPMVINSIITKNGIVLQKNPMFTDQTNDLSANDFYIIKSTEKNKNDIYRANYTISLWLYLNEQSFLTTPETEPVLFSYGFTDKYGKLYAKPVITFRNSSMEEPDQIAVSFSGLDGQHSTGITVPKQKWNNIVVTYNNNTVDLFVNGNLERSMSIADNSPIFDALDKITIGQNGGALGAIRDVVYYTVPLNKTQIVSAYNLKRT